MASLPPLKELITNTTLGDMDKILSKDPFPQVKIGYFNLEKKINLIKIFF